MPGQYVQAAMRRARYENLEDDGGYYGEIPGFDGVYATGCTLEACREDLEEVLEEWLLLRVSKRLATPNVEGISFASNEVGQCQDFWGDCDARVVARVFPRRLTMKRRVEMSLRSAVICVFLLLLALAQIPATAEAVAGTASLNTDLPVVPDGVASRAITWENQTGEPGKGGMAKEGRKGSPCIPHIEPGETKTLMNVAGCGVIRHIWITVRPGYHKPEGLRNIILRMYWDGSEVPSVEVPMGDFFGVAHGWAGDLSSAYVTRPRGKAFNCWFPMPFATQAVITVRNEMEQRLESFFFQIDYEVRNALPLNTGRFHAQFRRENPTTETRDFVILDGVKGPGLFLGCVIGVRPMGKDWWGEGEMKFYMDGDTDSPTICGTGTEDYFGTGWGMGEYITPYQGCPLYITGKDDFFEHGLVSMYRWHEKDPVYFRESLKATIQQLGWTKGIAERSDDWSSVAFWYQLEPNAAMPPFPDRAARTADLVAPPKEK